MEARIIMLKRFVNLAKAVKHSVVKQAEYIEEDLEDKSGPELSILDYAEFEGDKLVKITDFEMLVKAINSNHGSLDVWHDVELGKRRFIISIDLPWLTQIAVISPEDFCALRDAGIRTFRLLMRYNPDGTWSERSY